MGRLLSPRPQVGEEEREDDPDYTTFRPLILLLGGGRRLGIDDLLVRYNLGMWLIIAETKSAPYKRIFHIFFS